MVDLEDDHRAGILVRRQDVLAGRVDPEVSGGPAAGRLATPEQGGPDVIMSVEGAPVTTPDALRDALRTASHATSGDAASIVTLRVYNVPSKTRRVERIKLTTSSN